MWIEGRGLSVDCSDESAILFPPTLDPFASYAFCGSQLRRPAHGDGCRYNRYSRHQIMIPLIPKDMLVTTVETMCYFCTVVVVLLTCMLAPRR